MHKILFHFIRTIDKYLLGSKDVLTVEVAVSNYGEDAFEAGFYMTFPPGLNFRKVEKIGEARDTPLTCTAPSAETNYTLKCDIGNPLSSGKSANFKVVATPSQKYGMAPSYDFYMEANSTNAELEDSNFDNIVRKSIGIWVETDLSVSGVAHDAEFHYNTSEYIDFQNATKEHEIGPHVVTIYEIRNGGPSTIEEAEVYLLVPYETLDRDPLMYLLNQPEIAGTMKCEPTLFANPKNLQIDQVLERKSYLETYGAVDSSSYTGTGVFIEKGSGGSVGTSGGATFVRTGSASSGQGGKVQYTEEERRKLDAEENEESIGDASYVHRQRAGQASHGQQGTVVGQRASNRNAGQQQTYTSSWNTSSQGSGPTVTYTASRNRTVIYNPDGTTDVIEHSTENYHGAQPQGYAQTQYGVAGGSATASAERGQNYAQTYHGSGTGTARQYGQNYSHSYHGGTSAAQQASQNSSHQSYQDQNDRYRSNRHNTYTAGLLKVDDIPTEENVNQDLAHVKSQTHAGFSRTGSAGAAASAGQATLTSGRRRMMSQQDGEPPRPDLITGATPLEKLAQGGHGFQVGTLDLGISRGNVEEEMNAQGRNTGTIHGTMGGGTYSSGATSGGAHSQHHYQNYSSGTSGGTTGHQSVRYYKSGGATGTTSGGGTHHHTQHHAASGATNTIANQEYEESDYTEDIDDEYYEGEEDDNVGHYVSQSPKVPDQQKFKHYPRTKRQIFNFSDLELQEALKCNNTRCAVIRCIAGPLEKDHNAWISIRTRLVSSTMHKVSYNGLRVRSVGLCLICCNIYLLTNCFFSL